MLEKKNYLTLSYSNINFNKLEETNNQLNKNILKGIIGDIISKMSYKFKKSSKSLETEDYKVDLCSKELHSLYGNDYKKNINVLLKKIIFKYAYTENQCYQYAINDVTRSFNIVIESLEVKSTKDRGLINRLKKKNRFAKSKTKNKYRFLLKFFDESLLKIDVEKAKKILDREYNLNKDKRSYLINLQNVVDFHNSNFKFFYNEETDARLHSNLTFLNKKFRSLITFDDKKIVEIDIVNSIPTIFSLLLSKNINNSILSNISNNLDDYLYMFNELIEMIDIIEIELFQSICLNGKIYDYFIDDFKKKNSKKLFAEYDGYFYGEDVFFDQELDLRKLTKRNFMSMLFSENDTYSDFEEIFKIKFPSIFNFIYEVKRKEYKKLSHLLLQIESEVILNNIARDFNKYKNGKTPLFTVHDCICTTLDNEDDLRNFMLTKFTELFNQKISIKIKYW